MRFAAADIPEKKRGAGTVAGIAMKDGEKLSDVFFVWPEDVKKAAKTGDEETPAGENSEEKNKDDAGSVNMMPEAMLAGGKEMPVDDSVNLRSPSPDVDGVSDSPYTSSNLRTDGQPKVGRGLPSIDETAAAKGDNLPADEQQPAELILILKNKKQIPFSKLAKAKRGGKGTLKKI